MIAADDEYRDAKILKNSGMNDVIVHPIDMNKLKNKLRKVLKR